jgi:Protein of unknown function (DUF1353)
MLRRSVFAVVLAAGFVGGCDQLPWLKKVVSTATGTFSNNSFKGIVQAEFILPAKPDDNFRDMKLLNSFGFVDPRGVSWDVPAGYVTNGASVPWGLWNIVGGPFDGPYRDAAVLHDYYTDFKVRTWEDTHRMYYEASIARGVSESRAGVMYAGLLVGADRWDPPKSGAVVPKKAQMVPNQPFQLAQVPPPATNKAIAPGATPSSNQQQLFNELKVWIEREKPSPEQIAKRVEEMRKARGMPAKPQ